MAVPGKNGKRTGDTRMHLEQDCMFWGGKKYMEKSIKTSICRRGCSDFLWALFSHSHFLCTIENQKLNWIFVSLWLGPVHLVGDRVAAVSGRGNSETKT